MKYAEGAKKLAAHRDRIAAIRAKMSNIRKSIAPQKIDDYSFTTVGGKVRLSELFGDKNELFVIHNMGASCPYCTLWADGYNGIYRHVANRAAFVVTSPDAPASQKKFAKGRGWRFPMISHKGTTFAEDMGYGSEKSGWLPGISVFRRNRAKILRVADAGFRPGDDFCGLWHTLDLLPDGPGAWQPKFKYP